MQLLFLYLPRGNATVRSPSCHWLSSSGGALFVSCSLRRESCFHGDFYARTQVKTTCAHSERVQIRMKYRTNCPNFKAVKRNGYIFYSNLICGREPMTNVPVNTSYFCNLTQREKLVNWRNLKSNHLKMKPWKDKGRRAAVLRWFRLSSWLVGASSLNLAPKRLLLIGGKWVSKEQRRTSRFPDIC